MSNARIRIVLGVIGADCHSVGNQILEGFFAEAGFDVTNLGVMVSTEEFVKAAQRVNAHAILISSLYGHAEIDCSDFRQRCTENGLPDILLYVGGNLVVGKTPAKEIEVKFRAMGFDRVFPPDADLDEVVTLLQQDIAAAGDRETA